MIGLTFDLQSNPATFEGSWQRALLSDGIIWGCGLSNTADSITLAKGQLILAGRRIGFTAPATVDLVGITSNFVRLYAKIDLSQTADPDTFEQGSFEYDFAATADGFAALTTEDVNDTGDVYEKEIAVYSITTGSVDALIRGIALAATIGGMISVVLDKDDWSAGEQTVAVAGVTADSKLVIGIDSATADATARAAAQESLIYATAQGDGTVTFTHDGPEPTVDIAMNVLVMG